MRTPEEMFELMKRVAYEDDNILAVYYGGSRANPTITPDIYQDYDVVFVVKEVEPYTKDRSFVEKFGDVLLMQEDGRITLKVTDNGIGFKPFTYKSGSHQGLASIGEQVSLLDGTMNIQPATGGGTAVVISMPMNGGDSYENFVGR